MLQDLAGNQSVFLGFERLTYFWNFYGVAVNFYGVAVADLSCFSEGAQQFLIWIGHFLVVSVILAPSKSNLCALLIAVSSLRGGNCSL